MIRGKLILTAEICPLSQSRPGRVEETDYAGQAEFPSPVWYALYSIISLLARSPEMNSPSQEDELPEIHSPNARLGMVLFVVYLAAYAGFVGMAAFNLEKFASPSPLGPNWGLVYGLGLIIGAFVLAVIYMSLCRGEEPASDLKGAKGKEAAR